MGTPGPTLKQLRYFAAVVDSGSISRAAERLHVAQTAVGFQVRALEDCLECVLLERNHVGVEPTPVGRYVRERALEIIGSVDALGREIDHLFAETRRDISIGLNPGLMRGIGPLAVLGERKRLPGIHLHLVEAPRARLLDGLKSGVFDFVFAHDIEPDAAIRAVPLLSQGLVLVNDPELQIEPGPIALADALQFAIIGRGDASYVMEVATRAADARGFAANVAYEIDSLDAIKRLIHLSGAASIMTSELVADEVDRGELEVHEIVSPRLEMTLHFGMRAAEAMTSAELPLFRFLDDLIESYCRTARATRARFGSLTSLFSSG